MHIGITCSGLLQYYLVMLYKQHERLTDQDKFQLTPLRSEQQQVTLLMVDNGNQLPGTHTPYECPLAMAGTKLPEVFWLCLISIQGSDLVITHGLLSHLCLQELSSFLCHCALE